MESSAIASYIPQKSKQRVFSGSSSSCAEPEVIEIAPPLADRSSNMKSKGKQKEAAYHEIIDVDIYEDCNDVVLLEGKFESRKRKKGSMGISLGPSSPAKIDSEKVAANKKGREISGHSYKGFNPGSDNFFDLDDYVVDDDYWTLQSRFDSIGLPAGIEAPVPWLPDLGPMKEQNPANPFVTSNAHLEASPTLSHPNRVNSLSASMPTWLSSSENNRVNPLSASTPTWLSSSENNRVNPLSASTPTWLSSSENNTSVYGHSTYFDPKHVPAQTVHSNFTQTGSGNYLSNNFNTLAGNGTSSYPQLAMNTAYHPGMDAAISKWHEPIMKNDTLSGQGATVNGPISKRLSSIESSSSTAKLVDGDVQKRYKSFKKFDTVVDHSDHYFHVNHKSEKTQPPKNWAKKIQEEWRILEKDLPDTIFVRAYESRMDLLRAVIIGAEGTPYHDGLFFFDVCFPSSYPKIPPLVHYHSGGLRINPNLYNCGKVCLSLLNTWTGGQKEKWIPGTSTMLQVLVSIQGLILNMKPYFNEPGYASSSGTAHGESASLQYNENTLILSLKTMVYTMKKPPKNFEDLVIGHFQHRERDILMACKAYTEGVQVGCLVKGGVQDVDEGSNSCSPKFKQDVGSYIKTLIAQFKKLGSKGAPKSVK